ncbi:MAG: rod shape-determining protein RodA [Clostridiales bacterium]|nr:rod shape-determining protein RodA [Clostridiales bacterium]
MRKLLGYVRDYVLGVDRLLFLLCLLTTACGLTLVYSATRTFGSDTAFHTQLLAAFLGVAVFIAASCVPSRWLTRYWWVLLICNIILQILPRFIGTTSGGNRSWIRFLGIGIQPAEIGKVIFIITFAAHIERLRDELNTALSILQLVGHFGIIVGCVVLCSRDDGMALAYLFIGFVMLFAAGVKLRWFLAAGLTIAVAAPLLWQYVMDNYQKLRILVIFDPTLDPDRAYQAVQTRRAIASGQLTGQGFLNGSLTQRSLIPTKHTDAIYAVCGEEFGFLGAAIVGGLLVCIILRCLYLSAHIGGADGLICAGMGGMLMFQTVLNIGMNIGLLPVIGLTLPFVSYGGTSLVTMFGAMGIVAGIRLRSR